MLLLNIATVLDESNESAKQVSLIGIEACLTLIAVAFSFFLPRLGSSFFRRIERSCSRLAHRQTLSVIVVGCTALLLRLAILPICPIPLPFVPDDFSFLLSADTFAHGRLTNPTPAMWLHFETIHVTMVPTYMSMYFPAQGLLLALGTVVFGHPWYGLLISSALMCAAICWMLQAWLPAPWALLGGMLSVIHLGLFSYWINTYHAAGTICALGGALVLGSLPRLMKTARFRHGLLMALGISMLMLTRPYEGLLLCLPVALVLGHWALYGKNRPRPTVLIRRALLPLALIACTGAWLADYNYHAFGKATTMPYTLDRAQYALAPYFVWQQQRPEPSYRHEVLRSFYHEGELKFFAKIHSWKGFLPQTLLKLGWSIEFFAGFALIPPLFMLPRVLRDRRLRILALGMPLLFAGMLIQIFLLPHYLAPFTGAFYAFGLQAIRHMRFWKPEGKPVGIMLARLCIALCFVMAGLRLMAAPLHLTPPAWPAISWNFVWYGPPEFGTDRARVEDRLKRFPNKQLVLVRYSPEHNPFFEWVYNSADIDGSKVIWARDMDTSHNEELIHYYKDRQVWLAEPDSSPVKLTPYALPRQQALLAH